MKIIITTLLEWLGMNFFPINIGINKQIATNRRHGVIHSRNASGKIEYFPFIVDDVKQLSNPTAITISTIFGQIRRLGLQPTGLEVFTGKHRLLYRENGILPYYRQRM